jgi:hypothetical protein
MIRSLIAAHNVNTTYVVDMSPLLVSALSVSNPNSMKQAPEFFSFYTGSVSFIFSRHFSVQHNGLAFSLTRHPNKETEPRGKRNHKRQRPNATNRNN